MSINSEVFIERYSICTGGQRHIRKYDTLKDAWLNERSSTWLLIAVEKVAYRHRANQDYLYDLRLAVKNLFLRIVDIVRSNPRIQKNMEYKLQYKYLYNWITLDDETADIQKNFYRLDIILHKLWQCIVTMAYPFEHLIRECIDFDTFSYLL